MINYRQKWDRLISDMCIELIKIEELPKKSIEDIWVVGTIKSVLTQMCALDRVRPDKQSIDGMSRTLFTGLYDKEKSNKEPK